MEIMDVYRLARRILMVGSDWSYSSYLLHWTGVLYLLHWTGVLYLLHWTGVLELLQYTGQCTPRLGWMVGVKAALGSRGMTVEAAR